MPRKDAAYLGFDFGMRHIGIAIGQSVTQTASPLTTIQAKDGIPDWNIVAKLIATWNPAALIVGIPLNMDGSEQPISLCARRFAKRLQATYQLPVHHVDERLTTVEAKSQIFAKKGYRGLEKSAIDSMSAKLILESWLGEH